MNFETMIMCMWFIDCAYIRRLPVALLLHCSTSVTVCSIVLSLSGELWYLHFERRRHELHCVSERIRNKGRQNMSM